MKKLLLPLFLLASLSTPAMADLDDISLGEPGYGGSGCPAGTASVTLSPDKKALSILFDEYMVEAGGRKKVKRKNCNIAIPVHVPSGYAVSLIDVDYRGYISLPRKAQARFTAEYFFAGSRGPRYMKTFRGYTDEDFLLSNKLAVRSLVWSKCGADVNLRVNTSMLLRNMNRHEDALAIVDSADFEAGIVYKLQWKKCHGGGYDDYDDFF